MELLTLNEKFLNGLAHELSETSKLHPKTNKANTTHDFLGNTEYKFLYPCETIS